MEMKNKRIEGIITSFKPLGYDHTETKQIGLLLDSYAKEKTPYYKIGIEDDSGEKEIVEMPIKISNEFERGFERGLVGQKVIFEREVTRPDVILLQDRIIVKSGIFEGVKYEHSEVY